MRRWTTESSTENEGEYDDSRLAAAARTGDDVALARLLTRYRPFARSRARGYFLAGGDHEDLAQEGMIGLYKAVRDFDAAVGTPFRSFAELCITRQILTAIKTATRYKHAPLNTSISLARPVGDGEDVLGDSLAAPLGADPAERLVSAERIRALQRHVDEALSELERDVLRLYVDGRSYVEIAAALGRHVKAIDNAIQRIKRKLDAHLAARELAELG